MLTKSTITTEEFMKLIMSNYGIKKYKYVLNQFIKSTGIPNLDVLICYFFLKFYSLDFNFLLKKRK